MTNILERALEAFAFAILIAAAVGFWYITPAHAGTYCYHEWSDDGKYMTVRCR